MKTERLEIESHLAISSPGEFLVIMPKKLVYLFYLSECPISSMLVLAMML